MNAAQLAVTGRPDEVQAVLTALRDGRHLHVVHTYPARRCDHSTVSVCLDVLVDEDTGRAA